ncbi:hypothetical protein B0I32_1178 [Nonomuraea fuscirosea]|uniref:Uncharacterized protein n=1 Tax=Nonomuraea fuscirosea TaxID=1291556 RepID=A0A2T0MQ25_9ACTN|nr:hypothetical protein [Nonomuraea fuscirosea]PRX60241.1 hypothetical protein B0I32_1178 [Nonomuraea fuscirosea]
MEVTLTRPCLIGKLIVIRDNNIRHPGATCAVLPAFGKVTYRAVHESYWNRLARDVHLPDLTLTQGPRTMHCRFLS